jgi:hypothetical protein
MSPQATQPLTHSIEQPLRADFIVTEKLNDFPPAPISPERVKIEMMAAALRAF